MVAVLTKWVRQRASLQRRDIIVVTCRPEQLNLFNRLSLWFQGFRMIELEPLNLGDVEDLVERTCSPRDEQPCENKQTFIDRLHSLHMKGEQNLYEQPFMACFFQRLQKPKHTDSDRVFSATPETKQHRFRYCLFPATP